MKTFPYLSYGTKVILGIDNTVPLLSSVDETKHVLSTTNEDKSSHLIVIDNVCPIVPPSYIDVRMLGLPVSVDFFCVTVIMNCPFFPPFCVFTSSSLLDNLSEFVNVNLVGSPTLFHLLFSLVLNSIFTS